MKSCGLIIHPSRSCRQIPDRVAYAEALTKGTTIFEEQPRGPGPQDFRALLARSRSLWNEQNRCIPVRPPADHRRLG